MTISETEWRAIEAYANKDHPAAVVIPGYPERRIRPMSYPANDPYDPTRMPSGPGTVPGWNGDTTLNPIPERPKEKPKRRLVFLFLAVVAVVGVCTYGLGMAVVMGSGTVSSPAVAPSVSPDPEPLGDPAAITEKPKGIGEGTYEVGPDVSPGKYRTAGAEPSVLQLCSWTIRAANGEPVDFGVIDGEDEPANVTLKKGQEFQTNGCKPWMRKR